MVSVICCTKRADFIDHVFKNFERQSISEKEMIIVLNNDELEMEKWKEHASESKNISIYQVPQDRTLGECLNFAISKANYEVVAKFDDDDFYGPNYLTHSLKVLEETDADVIGKASIYVYFEKWKKLAIYKPYFEGRYVTHALQYVMGSTFVFRKSLNEVVPFTNRNVGEDTAFCWECLQNGYKIYSASKEDYVYIRYANDKHHTSQMKDRRILSNCKVLGVVDDYTNYIHLNHQ